MNMNDEKYSRNQCSMIIRVDGEEVEVPINFGMTADEIRALYPYLLPLVNNRVQNPAVVFSEEARAGRYNGISDDEYYELLDAAKRQSRFWFDKTDASLLEIALRFAVDIKLKGIKELEEIFDTSISAEGIEAEPISEDESQHIINKMNLETPTDYEFDPGDEQDIPLGVAGGLNVDLYNSGEDEDYLSQELDAMESKLDVQDKFEDIINSELNEDDYKSDYKAGKFEEHRVKDGLLDMYDESNESKSIFDKMDEQDGLNDINTDAEDIPDDIEDDFDEDVIDDEIDDEVSEVSFDDDDMDDEDDEEFIDDLDYEDYDDEGDEE